MGVVSVVVGIFVGAAVATVEEEEWRAVTCEERGEGEGEELGVEAAVVRRDRTSMCEREFPSRLNTKPSLLLV